MVEAFPAGASRAVRVLTINTGSSSLKAGLYLMGEKETVLLSVQADRLGLADSRFHVVGADGRTHGDDRLALPDHTAALEALFATLRHEGLVPEAIGHRVVHGGASYAEPSLVTPDLIATLEDLIPVAPDHLPQAIQALGAVGRAFPDAPQVACFDTAFHRRMPRRAQQYPLPRRLGASGVVRYGFHGLSYEYVMHELRALAPAEAAGRVLIAHLGNGASIAAVRGGTGVETTMGFTPAGGLVMGTRSGDLDPGVLIYLLEEEGMTPAALNTLVNQQAGLLGVSGTTGDMRDLLAREESDPHAAEAIELFCYQAKKFLGALAAALGGVDTVVFTGGIGEHAAPVRVRICAGLEFLGIRLHERRNTAHAAIISHDRSPVTVRVIRTDEDLMVARHTRRAVEREGGGG
jgi:acetate kinase